MKKVIKHHTYLFTFLLFFILRIGLSQNPIPKIIPPSPNAASLGQFGNIPVNMSAGLPNISIPLYEANQGGLILPISLFYNYSGFHPAEESSSVGLGWALKAGGVITRTKKGNHPDEKQTISGTNEECGFIMNTGSSKSLNSGQYVANVVNSETGVYDCSKDKRSTNPCSSIQVATQSTAAQAQMGWLDSEPDVFNFTFGDESGEFYLGADGEVKVISEKPLKVSYTLINPTFQKMYISYGMSSNIINWTITTGDGTKYKFGFVYNQYSSQSQNVDFFIRTYFDADFASESNYNRFINAWYLYEIETVTGQKISFSYTNDNLDNNGNILKSKTTISPIQSYFTIIDTGNNKVIESEDKLSFVFTENTENYIKSIYSSEWKINFDYLEISKELPSMTRKTYNKLLSKIDILSSNSNGDDLVKSYKFTINQNQAKPILSSIDILDKQNTSMNFYTFEYHPLPNSVNGTCLDIDYWNYYNYNSAKGYNTGLIPFSVNNKLASNREPNVESTRMGALNKIKYPTGGTTEFIYEQNDYAFIRQDTATTTKKTIGGLRIIKTIDAPLSGSNIEKTYQYLNFDNPTQSSGIVNEITIPYAFNFQLWVSCLYSDYFCTNNKKYKFNVYKSDPFYQMSLNPVYYFNVRESINNNGKTDFTFTSHFDYNDFLGTSYSLGSNKMGPYSSTKYARTKIKNTKIYKTNGSSEQVTLEKTINYKLVTKNKTSILHIDPIVVSKSFGSIFLIKGLNINSGLLQNIQETETQKFD